MRRYFEFKGADQGRGTSSSSKFWEAWVDGSTLHTRFGKIGANGQTTVKEFPDETAAQVAQDKAVTAKQKKGYIEVEQPAPPAEDDPEENTPAQTLGKEESDEEPQGNRQQPLLCGSCGSDASPGSKFCSECGNELLPTPSFCSECGSPLANTTKFCGSCGVAVGGAPEQVSVWPGNAGREVTDYAKKLVLEWELSGKERDAVMRAGSLSTNPETLKSVFEEHGHCFGPSRSPEEASKLCLIDPEQEPVHGLVLSALAANPNLSDELQKELMSIAIDEQGEVVSVYGILAGNPSISSPMKKTIVNEIELVTSYMADPDEILQYCQETVRTLRGNPAFTLAETLDFCRDGALEVQRENSNIAAAQIFLDDQDYPTIFSHISNFFADADADFFVLDIEPRRDSSVGVETLTVQGTYSEGTLQLECVGVWLGELNPPLAFVDEWTLPGGDNPNYSLTVEEPTLGEAFAAVASTLIPLGLDDGASLETRFELGTF